MILRIVAVLITGTDTKINKNELNCRDIFSLCNVHILFTLKR